MKRYTRLCLLLLLIASGWPAHSDDSFDYQLKDLDGVVHKVSDLRGKWLVMNFWATWCPPCIREMPELESFYQNHRDSAEVWGISFEMTAASEIKSFVKKLNVSYPILGNGQEPETGFGRVKVLPTTFIIDRNGKFLHRFEGPITEQDIVEVISAQ